MSETKRIELPPRAIETLFGVRDENIKYLESILTVRVNPRGQDLNIDGDPQDVQTVENILQDFGDLFSRRKYIYRQRAPRRFQTNRRRPRLFA